MKPALKLIISLAIPLAIGAIGGFFSASSVNSWFTTLHKPSFNPPVWIFFPVWTVLYILMGIAFFLVWNHHAKLEKKYTAYTYYFLQLALNLLWSFLFFYFHHIGQALADIILLFLLITGTISSFRKISKTAAWLLVPYLLWVGFALLLNLQIWRLN